MAFRKFGWSTGLVVILVFFGSCSGSQDGWRNTKRRGIGGSMIGDVNGGTNCGACTFIVAISEQLSEIHNETVVQALERICQYLPESFRVTCDTFVEIATPVLIEMTFDDFITPDVACHLLNFCYTESGQPTCHLYPEPSMGLRTVVNKVRQRLPPIYGTGRRFGSDPCANLPVFKEICEIIEKRFGDNHLPALDIDQDDFGVFKTLRGSYWRGKDCNDFLPDFHPGTKAINNDEVLDSNCNGIFGIDPKFNKPYEETLCSQTQHMGFAILGDSAGAHFHLPKEWFTATEVGPKAFENLAMIVENEIDWPMTSSFTGFMNSTWSVLHGTTDSLYLHLRDINHCNHRDFQNIAVNGGDVHNTNESNQYGLSRDQERDHPLMVVYSLVGNDVCNGHNDTIAHMTTPEQMQFNFISSLKFLDTKLPKGSHVIVTGLADGRVLYDSLKNRIHPLGEWRKDVTYPDVYSYLQCLQVSPCNGWLTTNETLRNITSQRAFNLSLVLQRESAAYKASNFDIHYIDFDFQAVINLWNKEGGETWQLIEPVDGFHPGQLSMPLFAKVLWAEIERQIPDVIKTWTNPNNARIKDIFGDQGGY